jgi:hypothetical protein
MKIKPSERMCDKYQHLNRSKLIEVTDSLSESLLKLPQEFACLSALDNSLLGPDIQHTNLVTSSAWKTTIGSCAEESHCVVESELPATLESPVLVLTGMVAIPVVAMAAETLSELFICLGLCMSDTRLNIIIGKGQIVGCCDGTVIRLLLEAPLATIHPVLVILVSIDTCEDMKIRTMRYVQKKLPPVFS